MASLLQRRRSTEANQTLHDVWPSTGWYTMYSFSGALALWRNFVRCKINFASKSCVLLYWQHYCTALEQRPSTKLSGVVKAMELRNFRRGRHLYSAGRPLRWASAHILVLYVLILGHNFINLWNLALLYATILINLLTDLLTRCPGSATLYTVRS